MQMLHVQVDHRVPTYVKYIAATRQKLPILMVINDRDGVEIKARGISTGAATVS